MLSFMRMTLQGLLHPADAALLGKRPSLPLIFREANNF